MKQTNNTKMRKSTTLTVILITLFSCSLFAQGGVNIEGYVFEDGNRGYLNLAKVTILDPETGEEKGLASTDKDGKFISILPAGKLYDVVVEKDLFTKKIEQLSTVGKVDGDKGFLRVQMTRKPGYIFDVTIAEKRASDTITVDAITGATIEVYNNTTNESTLTLVDHPTQTFKCHFQDGNHYTVLIRKKNYFNKRMEAFVNVKGCILCFEGVGEVKPSDVLSEGNSMGTLVANVSLEPIKMNEGIKIENILYDYAKATLTDQAKYELDKLINLLNNNPALVVELGSHTDSRGDDDYNFTLSAERAKAAKDYILYSSDIDKYRIRSQGYGEIKPINKCKNGVNCTEYEHALNRRTELKVVGLLDIDPYKNKTLGEIIEEENFEKMLAEIQNQEQVVVTGDEQLEAYKLQEEAKEKEREAERLKDSLAMVNRATANDLEAKDIGKTKPIVAEATKEKPSEIVETTIETVIEKTSDNGETIVQETEIVEVEKASTTIPTMTEEVIEDVGESKEVKLVEPVVESKKIAETPTTNSEIGNNTNQPSNTAEVKIFKESAIDTPLATPRAIALPAGYSGYRVEFVNSPYELPGSHEIFFKHGRITLDQQKDGSFSYLLGAFNEFKDADDFLKNIMIRQYPKAKVVHYKKGNRING